MSPGGDVLEDRTGITCGEYVSSATLEFDAFLTRHCLALLWSSNIIALCMTLHCSEGAYIVVAGSIRRAAPCTELAIEGPDTVVQAQYLVFAHS